MSIKQGIFHPIENAADFYIVSISFFIISRFALPLCCRVDRHDVSWSRSSIIKPHVSLEAHFSVYFRSCSERLGESPILSCRSFHRSKKGNHRVIRLNSAIIHSRQWFFLLNFYRFSFVSYASLQICTNKSRYNGIENIDHFSCFIECPKSHSSDGNSKHENDHRGHRGKK